LQAASEGNFHIYAVASVDEALSLLLHAEAGVKDADGNWPEASINGRIQARLVEMACIRASFADQAKEHDEATRPADRVDGLHE
jgi:predicted ATP-dependent protease